MMKYLFGIVMLAALIASCGSEDENDEKKGGKFYTTEIPEANVLRVGIKQLEVGKFGFHEFQGLTDDFCGSCFFDFDMVRIN
jgi:hypothetical protein